MADRLEKQIFEDIVTGMLPPGSRIRLVQLASSYEVSVTPLREALKRLSAQGIIESDPFVGDRVAPMSKRDIQDIYEVRLMLEVQAARRSLAHAGEEWERTVLESFERLHNASSRPVPSNASEKKLVSLDWLSAHRAFHWNIVSACDSSWLLYLLGTLYRQIDRYAALAWTDRGLQGTSLAEHRQIFDYAIDRDEDGLTASITEHVRSSVAWIEAVADSLLPDPGEPGSS